MNEGQAHDRRGNVFADLDLPDPEGALVRAELAFQINAAIEAHGWSDALAARHLGLTEQKVANLRRGRLATFSTDDLFHFLNELNIDIEITRGAERVDQPCRPNCRPGSFAAAGGPA